jgi:hypothetical protein
VFVETGIRNPAEPPTRRAVQAPSKETASTGFMHERGARGGWPSPASLAGVAARSGMMIPRLTGGFDLAVGDVSHVAYGAFTASRIALRSALKLSRRLSTCSRRAAMSSPLLLVFASTSPR